MKKRYISLLLASCLLVVGAICLVFLAEGKNASQSGERGANTTATPEPTATPEVTQPPAEVTPTPEPTATPEPTPAPTPEPAPTATPEPTPSPTPVKAIETSGAFRSDTGSWLNLVVYWEIIGSGEEMQLQLDAYAESYDLITYQRTDDVVFTVNGGNTYASSGPITLEDSVGLTESLLGSSTVDLGKAADAKVSVTWYFMGVYGNKEIYSITAETTIPLS